jgi:TrmH family RNA methyltransferase
MVKIELAGGIAQLRDRGVKVWSTSSHKGTPLHDADLTGPTVVLIGNEGAGLSREAIAAVDEMLVIPHSPRVESLNAGIAASLIVYEAARQRSIRPVEDEA